MGMDALNTNSYQASMPMVTSSYQSSIPAAADAFQFTGSEAPAVASTGEVPGQQQQQQPFGKQGKNQASDDQIKSAITSANRRAHFGHTNAEFSYHEATKRISVKIIDKDTNEVIKEIPPEETLEMISKMWELAGIMVDEKR